MYYNRKSNVPDGRKRSSRKLVIPEYKTLELDTIFLDMNGTIAVDGVNPAECEGTSYRTFRAVPNLCTDCRYAWKCESAVRRASGDPGDISDR